MSFVRVSSSAIALVIAVLSTACRPAESKPPQVAALETPAKAKATRQVGVTLDASQTVLASDKPTELFVRVRVAGLPIAREKRPPINLALVVDTWGSMAGPAIERAREACSTFADALGEGDTLSIVSFGSKPTVLLPARKLDAEARAAARAAIGSMKAEGTTDMGGGLAAGLNEVSRHLTAEKINRVVLLGDGVPNDPALMASLGERARQLGAPITSLGLGVDFDETLMTGLARTSGGAFHFVAEASEVAAVFEREVSQMQRLVARGSWVEVTPGPGVTIKEAIGVEASATGRSMRFSVGDLSEGQARDAVLRVEVAPRKADASVELIDASVHYAHAVAGVELVETGFLGARSSADGGAVTEGKRAEIEHLAARLGVADGIVRAIALARAGDVRGARALLDRTTTLATTAAKTFGDDELAKKAAEAKELKKTIASLAPPPEPARVVEGGPHPAPPRPMMKPVAPEVALSIKNAHGGAMRVLQGM